MVDVKMDDQNNGGNIELSLKTLRSEKEVYSTPVSQGDFEKIQDISQLRRYVSENNMGGKFMQVPVGIDTVELGRRLGMTFQETLEELDPSYYYDNKLGEISAFERQQIRLQWKSTESNHFGPRRSETLEFMMKNTPLSAIMFPEKIMSAIHWETLIDVEFDPNMLIAGTTVQTEDITKAVIVDDSQFRNRRKFKHSEGATLPVSTLRHSSYKSGVSKHGAGLAWSREFARKTNLDLFNQAIQRLGLKERRDLFDHIIDVMLTGDNVYGVPAATAVNAGSFDSEGISGSGEYSYLAQSRFLYGQRPYGPSLALVNVNTHAEFIGAAPPAEVTNQEILNILMKNNYPSMPKPINPSFLGTAPPALVVANDILADDKIIYMDVKNGLQRIVIQGSDIDETDYAVQQQMYKRFFTIEDGFFPHPSYPDAVKVMNLEPA